tara:strand:- start:422 stop:541 length:120 start_codon:yes stop_codon:yes gene_type:complete
MEKAMKSDMSHAASAGNSELLDQYKGYLHACEGVPYEHS